MVISGEYHTKPTLQKKTENHPEMALVTLPKSHLNLPPHPWPQPLRQVRVGNEWDAECHRIGPPVGEVLLRRGSGSDPSAAEDHIRMALRGAPEVEL